MFNFSVLTNGGFGINCAIDFPCVCVKKIFIVCVFAIYLLNLLNVTFCLKRVCLKIGKNRKKIKMESLVKRNFKLSIV